MAAFSLTQLMSPTDFGTLLGPTSSMEAPGLDQRTDVLDSLGAGHHEVKLLVVDLLSGCDRKQFRSS